MAPTIISGKPVGLLNCPIRVNSISTLFCTKLASLFGKEFVSLLLDYTESIINEVNGLNRQICLGVLNAQQHSARRRRTAEAMAPKLPRTKPVELGEIVKRKTRARESKRRHITHENTSNIIGRDV